MVMCLLVRLLLCHTTHPLFLATTRCRRRKSTCGQRVRCSKLSNDRRLIWRRITADSCTHRGSMPSSKDLQRYWDDAQRLIAEYGKVSHSTTWHVCCPVLNAGMDKLF